MEYLEFDEYGTGADDDADVDAHKYDDTENDETTEMGETIASNTTSSAKPTAPKRVSGGSNSKRSYPFRCKKCARRFMYKEVYEAHMRVHKGLPAFA